MSRVLSKPSTSKDDASPSESCLADADRVLRLIDDERHMSALALYQNIQERLKDLSNVSLPKPTRLGFRPNGKTQHRLERVKDMEDAKQLLESKQGVLDDLEVSRPCGSCL